MGGRGSNSGLSPKPTNAATSVSLDDGTEIDLSDFPLTYGEKDAYVDGDRRKAIEEFEDKRYKAKIEYGQVIDKDGNVLYNNKGSKGRCHLDYFALQSEGGVATHNHPRSGKDAGALGGTFSIADLTIVANRKISTIRATAAEGTYSITKQAGFKASEFLNYANGVEKRLRAAYNAELKTLGEKLNADYKNAKSPSESKSLWEKYHQESTKAFNKYLVNSHNSLLAGQKEYGYSYSLERREKKEQPKSTRKEKKKNG